jgi:pyruvate-ferredoxin/flavodoxin oxidoreductase
MKKYIANNKIKFYTVNATKVAAELGLGNRTNTVLQSAFFKLANIINYDEAVDYMKKAIFASYGKKGEAIVNMNNAAVDKGGEMIVEITVPESWKTAVDAPKTAAANTPAFITDIVEPINAQKGDDLPVSAFKGREDGTFPQGTAAYEKRGIAVDVPEWIPENCIQCNQCSYVCPHATIRPFLVTADEKAAAPAGFNTVKANGKGFEAYEYRMQVSSLDCAGCGNCAQVCPAKTKALVMKPIGTQLDEMANWNFGLSLAKKPNPANKESVKGSQFEQPLLEFSGACAGCGETPYTKLITQLFGDRMYIANATGCSSIWGGSAPSTPYCVNEKGQVPAWGNSLFEDNAEFGMGMHTAVKQIREGLKIKMQKMIELGASDEVKAVLTEWIENMNVAEPSKIASAKVVEKLSACACGGELEKLAKEIIRDKNHLVKKSQWIFGGDGWAYDIGFGGLDHVLASGEDVNILVLDTEVYSNTGGQASKSTPTAAIAKFAASGKKIRKKDLGMIAMSYGYVYVAQVGMGANQSQLIKALVEAESYPGPSIVIAYAPCINQGIRTGMGTTQLQTKKAVEAGYWHLYRYNPLLEDEGKNPFTLDSKEPTGSFQDFINGESRYSSLKITFPDQAADLFAKAEEDAKRRYDSYKRLAAQQY